MTSSYKINSLDKFYSSLNKPMKLAEGFTETPSFAKLIKACRLKPYDFVVDGCKIVPKVYHRWVDEYGNMLHLYPHKKIWTRYGMIGIPRDKLVCTDFYSGLSIDKISKMSQTFHIVCGKDEDLQEDYAIVTYLGLDGYLRSYMLMYGKITQVSPLMLDVVRLIDIISNNDIRYFIKYKPSKYKYLPCIGCQEWLSSLPVHDNLAEQLRKHLNTDVVSLFGLNLGEYN